MRAGDTETQAGAIPCRPIIWLWVLAIAQYGYRYILQVNDPGSSIYYAATPAALSAIKYALLLSFAIFSLISVSRRPASISRIYRMLLSILAAGTATLITVLIVRLTFLPGALNETVACAVKLIPWMISACLIPLVFVGRHSLTKTLATFEILAFWIIFPFWLMTVVLAIFGIRYPALSYPGLLVRFGGILDDPNGYACLCLLLVVLAAIYRTKYWGLRLTAYIAMLLATLSLAGYATAIVTCIAFLGRHALKRKTHNRSNVMKLLAISTAVLSIAVVLIAADQTTETVNAITSLYTAKSNSTAAHLSNLLPDEAAWDASSPIALLFGAGGFSENFYWEILANFGWIGLLAVLGVLGSWLYVAFGRPGRWASPIGIWSIAILIGSNGIAYLLTFPINLIFWSMLGLVVCARDQNIRRISFQSKLHPTATL
jgi:hypothetical protein